MNVYDSRPHILVVDDEPLLRTLLAKGLESQDYLVAEAADGEQAIAACAEQSFDLVLMDVSMPVMDGFTAGARISQQWPHLPIIMLTGFDDIESVNNAFESGATDFITKPINLPLLWQRVRYALRSTSALKLSHAYHDQNTACRLARLGFWQLNTRSGQLNWSKDAHELIGLSQVPEKVQDLFSLLTEDQIQKMTALFMDSINNGSTLDTEIVVGQGQDLRYIRVMADNALDPHIISGAFQDITEQRTTEQQIAHLAEHDALTGLPKRRLLLSQLQERMNQHPPAPKWLVAAIDIHRLQRINDALGSDAGDQLLIMIAQRLTRILPRPRLLGRLEDDCFLVALPLGVAEEHCMEWLRSVLSPLEEPWLLGEQQVTLNFKVGVAIQDKENQADQLLQAAVRTQTTIISNGRMTLLANTTLPYEDQSANLLLESQLHGALEQDQFFLLYQPQQRLEDTCIVSVEALARWQHPEEGVISPDRFIPLLENMGLMPEFAEWVLRRACRQALQWQAEGNPLTIAVNISASQFADPQMVDTFVAICREEGCPPSLLEIEVTESMAMTNPLKAIEHFNALRANGFRIAIDDFGVGYSSIEYLLHFPHDVLKIDRKFVNGVVECAGSRAIVRAVTTFCDTMKITCLAEGVESARQRDYLDALGVGTIQGYLLSRPINAGEITQFIRRLHDTRYAKPEEPQTHADSI